MNVIKEINNACVTNDLSKCSKSELPSHIDTYDAIINLKNCDAIKLNTPILENTIIDFGKIYFDTKLNTYKDFNNK